MTLKGHLRVSYACTSRQAIAETLTAMRDVYSTVSRILPRMTDLTDSETSGESGPPTGNKDACKGVLRAHRLQRCAGFRSLDSPLFLDAGSKPPSLALILGLLRDTGSVLDVFTFGTWCSGRAGPRNGLSDGLARTMRCWRCLARYSLLCPRATRTFGRRWCVYTRCSDVDGMLTFAFPNQPHHRPQSAWP